MTTSTDPTSTDSTSGQAPPTRWAAAEDRALTVLRRTSVPALRVALGIVFVWFGALKVTGDTPVGDLVAGVAPWLPEQVFVVGLGLFEVALGLTIIAGYRLTLAIAAMTAQLLGTFLVFLTQPEVVFTGGNPLLVTMEGEFVAKNIVLITAGLVVAAFSSPAARQARMAGRSHSSPST